MSKTVPKSKPGVDVLAALERLEEEVPLTPEEEEAMLAEAQFDQAGSLARLLALGDRSKAAQRRRDLEASRPAMEAALARVARPVIHRPRAENLALISALAARSKHSAQVMAFHRDYVSSSDADLDLLVAELEALIENER